MPNSLVRYQLVMPVNAVKLEDRPGSTLRNPTSTLVEIPAGATVELEGVAAPSGLIDVRWGSVVYSVFYDDLKGKAQSPV
jgi:hypothetical protein